MSGAERTTIGAERGSERIAVEIASFLADSPVRDLQEAVGQFVVYTRSPLKDRGGSLALSRCDPARL